LVQAAEAAAPEVVEELQIVQLSIQITVVQDLLVISAVLPFIMAVVAEEVRMHETTLYTKAAHSNNKAAVAKVVIQEPTVCILVVV
jgi:hypothetical protein